MTSAEWVADTRIRWRILLTARASPPVAIGVLESRLAALHAAQGWPPPEPVRRGGLAELRSEVAEVPGAPLVVGCAGPTVVISAHHAHVDGLGLLDVLAALTSSPVSSSTRGAGDRPSDGGVLSGLLGRLGELVFAPPAGIATGAVSAGPGDAFAVATVDGNVSTASLVHAAVRAVRDHNREAGVPARHVTVAVGAARRAEPGSRIANRSALLRLRNLEDASRDEIAARLRSGPLDTAGGTGAPGGAVGRAVVRVLAPRLGSTVLVSHLGNVEGPAVTEPTFFPVTAGGTGISLGALTHAGQTVLTLRGRASAWDGPTLTRLVDQVGHRLRHP